MYENTLFDSMRFVILLLALAFAACDSTEPDASGVGDLVLSIRVLPERPQSGPFLALRTVEAYGCADQRLEAVSNVGADRLTLQIAGVSESVECFPASTPAVWTGRIPYEPDADERIGYRIEVEKDGDTDTYEVSRGRNGLFLYEVEASFSSAPLVIPPGDG